MELTNDVLKKLVAIECLTIPYGPTVSQLGIVIDQSGRIAFPEAYMNTFLSKNPAYQKLVDDGLLAIKAYNDTAVRLELTESGQEYLDSIPASVKINMLSQQHLRVIDNVPIERVIKLCGIYVMQLTLEELPAFLSSESNFVRAQATKRFDELRGSTDGTNARSNDII